jgi:hypothetical protein
LLVFASGGTVEGKYFFLPHRHDFSIISCPMAQNIQNYFKLTALVRFSQKKSDINFEIREKGYIFAKNV